MWKALPRTSKQFGIHIIMHALLQLFPHLGNYSQHSMFFIHKLCYNLPFIAKHMTHNKTAHKVLRYYKANIKMTCALISHCGRMFVQCSLEWNPLVRNQYFHTVSYLCFTMVIGWLFIYCCCRLKYKRDVEYWAKCCTITISGVFDN